MNKTDKKIKLVTHNGSFHSDDIFACATLALILEKKKQKFEVIRTRDEDIIPDGDYVFDVGGIYNPKKNRFDHHQKGGAGKRKNGIEYASIGLVWKKFGKELSGSTRVAQYIDNSICAPIDANDNGFNLVKNVHEIVPFTIQHVFGIMRPTWKEKDSTMDKIFNRCVVLAKEILLREIVQAKDSIEAEEKVRAIYKKTKNKKIIILNDSYPYEHVLHEFKEPIYVIAQRKTDHSWGVKAVRKDLQSFKNKKDFPRTWAGLREDTLPKVSGVADAVFCHRALFLAVVRSKKGAIQLAEKALMHKN
jgi:uncharacterized UPF0160 family protein